MATSKFDVEFRLDTVQGRLYYARTAQGISRIAVSRSFGSRPDTIKNWERGENGTASVPYDYIVFAAIAFGVTEAWLLGETHETPLPPPRRQTPQERVMSCLAPVPETLMRRRLAGKWEKPERARPERGDAYVR